uniref:Uncharacterized protein n=1 Tax=Chromera velia CCMP2878 TaxID=1169474 RepID=A0A0G4I735_9ALVE|eukprot:Cvel_11500.t1-p1 / transcript=Cvel_11500.t1 / gene=Cvel_11500 / organism=Chromera_velia_CCMP2878 / gene_product=hypothetical protein / transcript_product=hypothetical protein / location=Cvel_scaffold725:31846-32436(+) / protein_length=197 / sequence_SO=supercontig / SO=protein_coding / is_pseudo=false
MNSVRGFVSFRGGGILFFETERDADIFTGDDCGLFPLYGGNSILPDGDREEEKFTIRLVDGFTSQFRAASSGRRFNRCTDATPLAPEGAANSRPLPYLQATRTGSGRPPLPHSVSQGRDFSHKGVSQDTQTRTGGPVEVQRTQSTYQGDGQGWAPNFRGGCRTRDTRRGGRDGVARWREGGARGRGRASPTQPQTVN